ncbi:MULTISPECIES: hypothetical protein [Vibrio]|uniref:hypothetical protein n=1 Tax=Vibrio TaxID=662 RepID=UPI000631D64C|nr:MULTISPECIES: hypothetical protein [Vibrio]ROP14769.1 hypothetical protein EDB33_11420 [Vibrio crassostreae]ROP19861.1 hypothetical protein EDB34_11420 [Vibrio crassostreae]RPE91084.1 hypothetical protein EDB15_11484 [Vibrio crassostreae]TCV20214.1 hypothetical protein EDB11_11613 [Vibrio crassostreae]TWD32148.1 hypothetical protein FB442_11713 [Vibrio crassostreae]
MSKLFKLKKHLTIEGAREYLSNAFEEKVSMLDLYKLALDGHLTISVEFFNYIAISSGRVLEDMSDLSSSQITISKDISSGAELKEPYSVDKMTGFPISLHHWLFFSQAIEYASGVWDLSMMGQERDHIENLYSIEAGGKGSAGGMNGRIQAVVLERYGSFCKLKDIERPSDLGESDLFLYMDNAKSELFYDTVTLDSYPHQLVIKTDELTRFVKSFQDESEILPLSEKPISTTERKTLLTLIGALLKEQQIDPSERGVTSSIKLMTDIAGTPITENTIRKILGQVSDLTA